ncbi:hypothetical protein KP626_04230 [Christensenella sp. MSJ-20]|uniref:hypothetical protein n=1 Tax=Christensenella sp. MSJ-20 TaxID=2841518 RepID=UPI001C7983B3|nr:hypothetical protein KP626_04230 [Christensenella sp. MSJ-20]
MKKIKYIVCIVISLNMLFCGSSLVDEEVRWGTILPFTLLCRDNIEEIYDFEHVEGYFGAEKDNIYLYCFFADYQYGNHENAVVMDRKEFQEYFDGLSENSKELKGWTGKRVEDLNGTYMRISAYLTCEKNDAAIARLYDIYEVDVGKKLVNEYQERCYFPNEIQRYCLEKEPEFNLDEVKQVSLYRFLWNPKLHAEQKVYIQGKFMAYTTTITTKETRCLLSLDQRLDNQEGEHIRLIVDKHLDGNLIIGYEDNGAAVLDPKYLDQRVEIIGHVADINRLYGFYAIPTIELQVDEIRLAEKREVRQ